jgi:hypothetical protein
MIIKIDPREIGELADIACDSCGGTFCGLDLGEMYFEESALRVDAREAGWLLADRACYCPGCRADAEAEGAAQIETALRSTSPVRVLSDEHLQF